MKKILIATALSGMLIPAIATAELNYNAVEASYAKTRQSGVADLTEFDIGVSKSITSNVFLEGSYGTGSQASGTALGDISVSAFAVGAGYHTPIQNDIDLIIAGRLIQGSAKLAGVSASANGYEIGAGLRAELTPKLEGTVSGTYTNMALLKNEWIKLHEC